MGKMINIQKLKWQSMVGKQEAEQLALSERGCSLSTESKEESTKVKR
jgi:hypothetical protein